LLFWCSIVEPELTFFEERREGLFMNASVLSQHAFGLVPKIFNAVDVVFALGKVHRVIDAFMMEPAHIKRIVGPVGMV